MTAYIGPETWMPRSRCPACGKGLHAASGFSNAARPKAGDITVCVYCATPLLFDLNLALRLPDAVETCELLRNERVVELQAVIRAVHLNHAAIPPKEAS